MAEAAPHWYTSQYVNTMDYFIDYYANYNENLKDFEYHNFFNSNEVSTNNCYIKIKIDESMSLYFIKGDRYSIPIGVESFYNHQNLERFPSNMVEKSQQIAQELIEGKEDITHVYDDILVDLGRERRQQYPADSWGPPPLAILVRSEPVIDYSIPDELEGMNSDLITYINTYDPQSVNRQLAFDSMVDDSDDEMPDLVTDMDDLTNQIIDEIRNTNIIKCPMCRTENSKEQCVDIKGSSDTCSICLEATVEVFFIGCGHAVTCKSCYEQLLNV